MRPGSKSAKKPPAKASKLVRDLKRQADSYKSEVESQNKKILELDRRMDSMKEMMSQQNARLAEQEREKQQHQGWRLLVVPLRGGPFCPAGCTAGNASSSAMPGYRFAPSSP